MKLDSAILSMLNAMAAPIITSREPDQVINRGDVPIPYMQRWYLLRKQEGGPIENLYLHRFLRSDAEQPHDHPWPWMTVVLSGQYVEWSPTGETLREAGDVAFKKATDIHAITAVQPGTVTAFLTGPKVRDWGFHTEHGLVLEAVFDTYRRFMAAGNEVAAKQCVASPSPWIDRTRRLVQRPDRPEGTMVIGGGTAKIADAQGKLCDGPKEVLCNQHQH